MGDVLSALSAAVGAADKVVELIHRQPATPPPGTYTPDTFAGRLQLADVHFRYPARPDAPVLNGLSLQVNPGEVSWSICPSTCCAVSVQGASHILSIALIHVA